MSSVCHRSPSNDTTESHPKYMTPERSWAADQAIVLTPVSRDENTLIGGIPSGLALSAKAAVSRQVSPIKMPTAAARASVEGTGMTFLAGIILTRSRSGDHLRIS